MMVAGVGCRAGATADTIAEALSAALERCGLARSQIDALATAADKSCEREIVTLAEALGLPLIFVPPSEMKSAAESAIAVSERVVVLAGVLTVAERQRLLRQDGLRGCLPRGLRPRWLHARLQLARETLIRDWHLKPPRIDQ